MDFSKLSVSGAFEIKPVLHKDDRGLFLEQMRLDQLSSLIGHDFKIRQANTSVSHKGVVRGVHFADVPPGQAKFVFVPHGRIIDYVIDIRTGSPTYGMWDSREISADSRNAIYIPEGLGHAFVSLENETVVTYLVSQVFNPEVEHGINPLDPDLKIEFPNELELKFSQKDSDAPSLKWMSENQMLPQYAEVLKFHDQLSEGF